MAADEKKYMAYEKAIQKAIQRRRTKGEEVHAVDLGSGAGVLAMIAARSAATSVVAVEAHGSLVHVARMNVARNGLSKQVSVVHADMQTIQRGREIRKQGANLMLMDLFDEGLLGCGVMGVMAHARRAVLQPDADVIPAAASVYCMGVQLLTGDVQGFDLAPFNCHRWDKSYEAVHLQDEPSVRVLTKPHKMFTLDFSESSRSWTQTGAVSHPGPGAATADTAGAGAVPAAPSPPSAAAAAAAANDDDDDDNDDANIDACGGGKGGISGAEIDARGGSDKGSSGAKADASSGNHNGSSLVCQRPPSTSLVKLEAVRDGILNAVLFWFDLHLDEQVTISSAPPSFVHAGNCTYPAGSDATQGPHPAGSDAPQATVGSSEPMRQVDEDMRADHHWGQALQYLECATAVKASDIVPVVARTSGPNGALSFSLMPGSGPPVPKSPWKDELGGGVSTENPHVQRAKYCELVVGEYLQRVPCGRFKSVDEEMQLMQAHCGSLHLDPGSVAVSRHKLALLELLHKDPHKLANVSPGAVSRMSLRKR